MLNRSRRLLIQGYACWTLGSVIVLTALDLLTFESVYLLSFGGLLAVFAVISTESIKPQWHVRLRYLVVLGLLGFVVLIVRRALLVLGN